MQRIAIDMDEVMADALGELLTRYNREFGEALAKEHLHGKQVREVVAAERMERVWALLHDPTFFRHLKVMPEAQEVIRELRSTYEVFITTAAMEVPCSLGPKYEWLKEHFPFVPESHFVFCGDKGVIAADYLIDDSVRHFRRFQGEGIVFTAPHNVHETGYRRVADWGEVREMFL